MSTDYKYIVDSLLPQVRKYWDADSQSWVVEWCAIKQMIEEKLKSEVCSSCDKDIPAQDGCSLVQDVLPCKYINRLVEHTVTLSKSVATRHRKLLKRIEELEGYVQYLSGRHKDF